MRAQIAIALIAAALAGYAGFVLARWLSRRVMVILARGRRLSIHTTARSALRQIPIPDAAVPFLQHIGLEAGQAVAGLGWSVPAFRGLQWLSVLLGSIGAILSLTVVRQSLLAGFASLGSLLLGFTLPVAWFNAEWRRQRRLIERVLPDFLDRLSLSLEAGLGFEPAMRRAGHRFPNPVGGAMRAVVDRIALGHSRESAMRWLDSRYPTDSIRALSIAVRQASKLGTPLARTLRVQVEWMRAGRRRRALEASRRLPVLVAFPLVFFFLPALLIVYLAPPLLHLFLGGP